MKKWQKYLTLRLKVRSGHVFRKWWTVLRQWRTRTWNSKALRWAGLTLKARWQGKVWIKRRDLKTCCGGLAKEWTNQGSNGLNQNHFLRVRQLLSLNHWAWKLIERKGRNVRQNPQRVQWLDGEIFKNTKEGHNNLNNY